MATIDGRPARYRISLKELRELMEHRGPEGIERIQAFGGIEEIVDKLYSSVDKGLSGSRADVDHRREMFGSNVIPPKPPKTFFQLICEAVQDITLIILIIAAVVSLLLSFYKPEEEEGGKIDEKNFCRINLTPITFVSLFIQRPSLSRRNITDGLKALRF